jgi:antitoxin (DNA-binding transcriptional repressor) of toxin-antitoxin stability system
MSATVTIEEAQAHLPELIAQLVPGEALIISTIINRWLK